MTNFKRNNCEEACKTKQEFTWQCWPTQNGVDGGVIVDLVSDTAAPIVRVDGLGGNCTKGHFCYLSANRIGTP